ncbi:hypothetical protein [Roseivirga pacifica]|uniref:hypothetical protein n=1 Tax=Roseivirga pacifica TaxID=1267423 RepID=UPI003BA95B00
MKKRILLIGILLAGFMAQDALAQRGKRDDDRGRDRREDVRRGDRRDDHKGKKGKFTPVRNDRGHRNDRTYRGRDDRRRGWKNYGRSTTVSARRYYDYDFRRGKRIVVRRGVRPSGRHIWVSGHWRYDRRLRRDVWIGGHWSLQRSYHRWVPAHYAVLGGANIWVEGCWTRVY